MKKIIAFVLCIALIMSAITSFAAVDESYKQTLEIIKSRIPDTSGYDDFTISQDSAYGMNTYRFSWKNSETKKYMNVTCFENGIISSFNINEQNNQQENAMYDISKEEALEKAKTAFYKLNPDLKDKTIIKSSSANKQLWETRQYFSVTRIENGIEVFDETGLFQMDINADKIEFYTMNWNLYGDYPNPEDAISIEDAKKAFIKKLGVHLAYKPKVEDGVIKPYLVYTAKDDVHTYIDMNGEVISCMPYLQLLPGYELATNKSPMANGVLTDTFTQTEFVEMEKLDGLLSEEEVLEIVDNQKALGLKWLYVHKGGTSLHRDYYDKDKYTYELTYHPVEGFGFPSARVTVDAKTGEILSLNKGRYVPEVDPTTVSEAEITELLKDAVKSICINNFDEYELVKSNYESVEYQRVVNGVKFPHDAIKITYDNQRQEISTYSKTYTKAEFPLTDGVVPLDAIYENVFDMFSYGLKYVPTYKDWDRTPTIKLVFGFDRESFDIDPFTGENYYPVKEEVTPVYEDINNHYAQKYIEELASYGIGIGDDKKFLPDNDIKQKELISLLVQSFYEYYSTYPRSEEEMDEYYEVAVREGIIEESEIDKEVCVTRKDAAKFLVNALGHGEVAKIDSIFNCPFSDVAENKGFVAILYGYGIVSGDEAGKFNPDENLLRGDTMIMLYKSLNK